MNTGYVGCENCYKEFANLILPRVSQMQQGLVHVGKMPAVAAATAEGEYAVLRRNLKKPWTLRITSAPQKSISN